MNHDWELLTASEADDLISTLPAEWRLDSDDEECIERLAITLETRDDISERVLEVLAYSRFWRIRRAVAASPSCSESFVDRLRCKKIKDYWGIHPDGEILQGLLDRSLPPEWKSLDSDELAKRLESGNVPPGLLELLAQHQDFSVVEAVVNCSSCTDEILTTIINKCNNDNDFHRVNQIKSFLGRRDILELGGDHPSHNEESFSARSKDLIGSLDPDCLELLFSSMAAAEVDDANSSDQSEVWTLMGKKEPAFYDYDSDSHTDTLEEAALILSKDLWRAHESGFDALDEKIKESRIYETIWERLVEAGIDGGIDALSEKLDDIISNIC